VKYVSDLTEEIHELESNSYLSPQKLRIALLKSMNYLLTTYFDSNHREVIAEYVEQLQEVYNELAEAKIIEDKEFSKLKEKVFECLNSITEYLAVHKNKNK
jgi:hypothetical protein